jgi:glutaredoxin
VKRRARLEAWRPLWAIALLIVGMLGATTACAQASPPARAPAPDTIEAFVREGCPHCAKAEEFLAQLGKERPGLKIVIRDVQKEPLALDRLKELARAQKGAVARVPAVYVGGQLIVGYSESAHSDRLIRDALGGGGAAAPGGTSHEAGTCDAEESLACPRSGGAETEVAAAPAAEPFQLEAFGRTITLDDVGLPVFTVVMGLLDGFNPCSMWVLLLMISLLAPLNDRRRMLAIAGTFVLVEGIAYFLFMAAWLNLFLLIGMSRASQLIIAAIAITAGLINVKDFFAFKWGGISLGIPEKAKPGIYNRMRGILHAENLAAAVVGAAILAMLVQVVEFLCTSGFPALFTRILTLRQLDTASYYGYVLLYNVAYMLDDVIILSIGVVMLSRHRLQEKEGRVLKFISGAVMIGLGLYLVFDG